MASAAEQMAANLSWGALSKATDLRQRIFFTIGLLIVYRIGTYIPVPGIDGTALKNFMAEISGGIGGMLNMFTGGAISRMGIFALGIMPYISASIIVQLMTAMVPKLEQLKKEGQQGQKKINQYTRYGTVVLASFQSYGIAVSLQSGDLVTNPGWFFIASCMVTLVGGTMFLMWLGEQITARGIGNGISLIIFAGIVAQIPRNLVSLFADQTNGWWLFLVTIVILVLTIFAIVFVQQGRRHVPVLFPGRRIGSRMSMPVRSNGFRATRGRRQALAPRRLKAKPVPQWN